MFCIKNWKGSGFVVSFFLFFITISYHLKILFYFYFVTCFTGHFTTWVLFLAGLKGAGSEAPEVTRSWDIGGCAGAFLSVRRLEEMRKPSECPQRVMAIGCRTLQRWLCLKTRQNSSKNPQREMRHASLWFSLRLSRIAAGRTEGSS